MFVNKTSCVRNIWYTEISITTTIHSACLRPFPLLLAVWKTERERGLCNYRGATEQTPDKRQALILAPETNHYKMAVIQEAGLET